MEAGFAHAIAETAGNHSLVVRRLQAELDHANLDRKGTSLEQLHESFHARAVLKLLDEKLVV